MIDHPSWHSQPYAEIVIDDCYRMRRLQPAPDTVYDIGANVGVFAAFAKDLWPDCKVIAVEPNDDNFAILKETSGKLPGVVCVNAAIGNGPIHWYPGPNRGGHAYLSPCAGYSKAELANQDMANVAAITIAELMEAHRPNGRYFVKIDVEGAEQTIFDDEESCQCLYDAHYFTAEIHFFAAREIPVHSGRYRPALLNTHLHVVRPMLEWCYSFTETHSVEMELRKVAGMIWAKKKGRK